MALLFVLAGLSASYFASDAALQGLRDGASLKMLSVEQTRRWMKIFFWAGLVYESIEAWVILGKFKEKEDALSGP